MAKGRNLFQKLSEGSKRIDEMKKEIKKITSMLHSFIGKARSEGQLPEIWCNFKYSDTCYWYFKVGAEYGIIEFRLHDISVYCCGAEPSLEHVQKIYSSLDFLLKTARDKIPYLKILWGPLMDASEYAEWPSEYS